MPEKFVRLIVVLILLLASTACGRSQSPSGDAQRGPSSASRSSSSSVTETEALPIRRVVLYQNGIGYFEREGMIESDRITLQIRPDEINDILKSLTILDLDNKGKAISISMPVEKGVADAMADLPAQIQNEGGLLTLLRTFRGARVTLRTTEGDQDGRITGVESIPSFNDQGQQTPGWRVMLRRNTGALDVIEVDAILGINIRDQTLEVGLEKSLDVSLNEGSWKPIELTIRLDAAVKRRVRVSYISAMPVWKPAYRLVIDEAGKGLFQGWAVVDNVSGADWEKISMSLVSGNPISFVYDLYEPQFVRRPDLSGRVQYNAMAPPKVESVRGLERKSAKLEEMKKEMETLNPDPEMEPEMKPKMDPADFTLGEQDRWNGDLASGQHRWSDGDVRDEKRLSLESFEGSFGGIARSEAISSLHEYRISGRGDVGVTIPDRSSALVNITQTKSVAKEIAIFQPQPGRGYLALNPYRAVEFENNSGHPLEPGPISLYRVSGGEATFIGESFLDRTEVDEKAFFTFALDPLIELETSEVEEELENSITLIKDGVLTSEVKRVNTVTYTLKNKDDEAIGSVISRPKRVGWELSVSGDSEIEEASHVNYLRQTIPAKGTLTVKLIERRTMPQRLYLGSYDAMAMLEVRLSEEGADPALKAALKAVMDRRAALRELDQALAVLMKTRAESQTIQRLNAELLGTIKDVRNLEANRLRLGYTRDMNNARTTLVKAMEEIAAKEAARSAGQLELEALYEAVTFDAVVPVEAAPVEGGAEGSAGEAPGAFESSEGYDRKLIERVASQQASRVEKCLQAARTAHPGAQGVVRIGWEINGKGSAVGVRVESDESGAAALGGCLVKVVLAWRFPPPTGGKPVTISYPFHLVAP